jgi:branched-chain amino acid transport system substrate-binding protein
LIDIAVGKYYFTHISPGKSMSAGGQRRWGGDFSMKGASIRLFLTASAVVVLVACGSDDEPAERTGEPRTDAGAPIVVAADAPIIIGVSVPTTGPDAGFGLEDRDAVITAVERWTAANGDEIAGHSIEVHVEDDGCTQGVVAAAAAERLVSVDGLVGVIGPDCSEGAAAAIPIYARAGIVAISGSATSTSLTTEQPEGDFFFRTAYRNDLQGTFIGLFAAAELRGEAAWLIDDGEDYGLDLADAAQVALEAGEVSVTRESIERGAVDFTPLAQRIASESPSFVGFAGFNPEAALLYRQLRDAGYQGEFGAADAAASERDFIEPVGAEQAEGVVFSGCPLVLPEDFVDDFEAVHGSPPETSPFVSQYADAATALLNAVAATASENADGSLQIDPAGLRDAVRDMTLQGVSGTFAFDANGDRVPEPGDIFEDELNRAIQAGDVNFLLSLGLVPCEVQDGRLVNQLGPRN